MSDQRIAELQAQNARLRRQCKQWEANHTWQVEERRRLSERLQELRAAIESGHVVNATLYGRDLLQAFWGATRNGDELDASDGDGETEHAD